MIVCVCVGERERERERERELQHKRMFYGCSCLKVSVSTLVSITSVFVAKFATGRIGPKSKHRKTAHAVEFSGRTASGLPPV